MKIHFLFFGTITDKHLSALIKLYLSRIEYYLPVDYKALLDLKNTKSLSLHQQKEKEGKIILNSIPDKAFLVLLDEHGKMLRSMEFAAYIEKLQSFPNDIYFVTGGPFGFSDQVYHRANDKISLSPMTFSHQMIRLLFVEQFYRALTIQYHHPYHHE